MSQTKERVNKQKMIADQVLNQLFQIDPYAIVAGGAPRDWYFGNEASDIDVFFNPKQGIKPKDIQAMLKHAGLHVTRTKTGEGIPVWYKKNPSLRCVYELEMEGEKVQMMEMIEPTQICVVEEFPLSLCKAWWKEGKAHYEKDFLLSVEFQSLYITNTLYNNADEYVKKSKK